MKLVKKIIRMFSKPLTTEQKYNLLKLKKLKEHARQRNIQLDQHHN
jgi:hypothetical protein